MPSSFLLCLCCPHLLLSSRFFYRPKILFCKYCCINMTICVNVGRDYIMYLGNEMCGCTLGIIARYCIVNHMYDSCKLYFLCTISRWLYVLWHVASKGQRPK